MNTYIVSFEHGPHMSDEMEVQAVSKEAAWDHAVSFCPYKYITRNWIELKSVVDTNNCTAITANERQKSFQTDFKQLLFKHRAEVTMEIDFEYTYEAKVKVHMPAVWVSGELKEETSLFHLDI